MQKNDFPEIMIGVDHGYKNVKTINFVFPTKLSQLKTVPDDKKGVLQISGNIYTENGEDVNYIDSSNKVSNDNFYMLTLKKVFLLSLQINCILHIPKESLKDFLVISN